MFIWLECKRWCSLSRMWWGLGRKVREVKIISCHCKGCCNNNICKCKNMTESVPICAHELIVRTVIELFRICISKCFFLLISLIIIDSVSKSLMPHQKTIVCLRCVPIVNIIQQHGVKLNVITFILFLPGVQFF